MGKNRTKFYAVARGRRPGIFSRWFGPDGAEAQVRGYPGARYKSFSSRQDATAWLSQGAPLASPTQKARQESAPDPACDTVIYTDGGCSCNPGPGGYGAVLISPDGRQELSKGFRLTTNNRMELMACIAALQAIRPGSCAALYSDSRYVVNGITKGWARKWQANGWMRTKSAAAENVDLWSQLLQLCAERSVTFLWVKGHAGTPENERCDQLATTAAAMYAKHRDRPYESGTTQGPPSRGRSKTSSDT